MSQTQQTDLAVSQDDPTTHALDKLAAVSRAIAEAHDLVELVPLQKGASALRTLTRQLGLNRDIQNQAALACIRAERKLGLILVDMPKAAPSGSNQYEDRFHDETDPPTLYE